MKHFISIIVYGNDKHEFRKDFQQPNIPFESYDSSKHTGRVYSYPDNFPTGNSMYVWQWVEPEDEAEKTRMEVEGILLSISINK